MNDSLKQAYSNAVAVIVDNYLHRLQRNLSIVYCLPNSKIENSISTPHNGEVCLFVRTDRDVLISSVSSKAKELNQRSPSDSEWSAVFSYFEIDSERTTLKISNDFLNHLGIYGGVAGGVAVGVVFAGPTFGLSLVAGALLGSWAGVNRQEKNERAASQENERKIDRYRQTAIAQIRSHRQHILEAILASNYETSKEGP